MDHFGNFYNIKIIIITIHNSKYFAITIIKLHLISNIKYGNVSIQVFRKEH